MAYQDEAPFHHSLLTTFRKRFTHDSLGTINEAIAQLIADAQPIEEKPSKEQGEGEAAPPKGQLLIDATCVPVDIKYPTDLHLLNEAREKTEEIIDRLHACRSTARKKPRTSRQNASRKYLRVAKSKKPRSHSAISGAIWERLPAWLRKDCSFRYPPNAPASCLSFKNGIGNSSGCPRTAVIASPIG